MSILGLSNLSARIKANLQEGAIATEDRIALARLEWAVQKQRMQTILVLGIVLCGLTIVALGLLSLAILVQVWDTPHRTMTAWMLAGIWMLAWIFALLGLLTVMRKSSQPFILTRTELARDWAILKEKL